MKIVGLFFEVERKRQYSWWIRYWYISYFQLCKLKPLPHVAMHLLLATGCCGPMLWTCGKHSAPHATHCLPLVWVFDARMTGKALLSFYCTGIDKLLHGLGWSSKSKEELLLLTPVAGGLGTSHSVKRVTEILQCCWTGSCSRFDSFYLALIDLKKKSQCFQKTSTKTRSNTH